MKTTTTVQENAEDILAEAKAMNEKRAEEEAANVIEAEERDTGERMRKTGPRNAAPFSEIGFEEVL